MIQYRSSVDISSGKMRANSNGTVTLANGKMQNIGGANGKQDGYNFKTYGAGTASGITVHSTSIVGYVYAHGRTIRGVWEDEL